MRIILIHFRLIFCHNNRRYLKLFFALYLLVWWDEVFILLKFYQWVERTSNNLIPDFDDLKRADYKTIKIFITAGDKGKCKKKIPFLRKQVTTHPLH